MANIAVSAAGLTSSHDALSSTAPAQPEPSLHQNGKQVDNLHPTLQTDHERKIDATDNSKPKQHPQSTHMLDNKNKSDNGRSQATFRNRVSRLRSQIAHLDVPIKSVKHRQTTIVTANEQQQQTRIDLSQLERPPFWGFLNLGIVLLASFAIHVLLGEIAVPRFADSNHVFATLLLDPMPILLLGSLLGVFSMSCFLVEWLADWMSAHRFNGMAATISTILHVLILTLMVATSTGSTIAFQRIQFSQGIIAMLLLLVTFMKTTSFAIVSTSTRRGGKGHCPSLKDFLFFMFAPVLVYQHKYVRSSQVSWPHLCLNTFSGAVMMGLFFFLAECLLGPALVNMVQSWDSASLLGMIDLTLVSSVSYFVTWVVFFWGFFYHGVSAWAELLCFEERCFFGCWWNSTSVDTFWRSWNLLVQKWLFLHVYKPLVSRGVSKQVAITTVFTVSAIGHEVVISVPLREFRPYAFIAMMLQVPIAVVSKHVFRKSPRLGNIFTWLWVMMSQCIALILYSFVLLQRS